MPPYFHGFQGAQVALMSRLMFYLFSITLVISVLSAGCLIMDDVLLYDPSVAEIAAGIVQPGYFKSHPLELVLRDGYFVCFAA